MFRCQRDHALAVGEIERQRLFTEYMLARLERLDDLFSVQRRRRHEEYGVNLRVAEEFAVVMVEALDAEAFPRPAALVGPDEPQERGGSADHTACRV